MLARIQEKLYLPLRAIWALQNGVSPTNVALYTKHLLTDIDHLPSPGCDTAVILGSTRATAFCVSAAVREGYHDFIVVGAKPIGNEHPVLTSYIRAHMTPHERYLSMDGDQPEYEYAEKLLLARGVPLGRIHRLNGDHSTNTGANMQVLLKNHFARQAGLEMYTLAGGARRAMMTARKVLGDAPAVRVHNAYPARVNAANWNDAKAARVHMTAEADKTLGRNPLYVRLGYAAPLDLAAERAKIMRVAFPCVQRIASGMRAP